MLASGYGMKYYETSAKTGYNNNDLLPNADYLYTLKKIKNNIRALKDQKV